MKWLNVSVAIIVLAGPANAVQQVFQIELMRDKSIGTCMAWTGYYTIDIDPQKFVFFGSRPPAIDLTNPLFSIPMPPDGIIKKQYKDPAGGNMEFTGNVQTGEYTIHNRSTHCWYKLNSRTPNFKP